MNDDSNIQAQFQASLKWHLGKLKHGEQKAINLDAGLADGYLSHLAAGRRFGTEQVRRAVAKAFGREYGEFLFIGMLILCGEEPNPPYPCWAEGTRLHIPVPSENVVFTDSVEDAQVISEVRRILRKGGDAAETLKSFLKLLAKTA